MVANDNKLGMERCLAQPGRKPKQALILTDALVKRHFQMLKLDRIHGLTTITRANLDQVIRYPEANQRSGLHRHAANQPIEGGDKTMFAP